MKKINTIILIFSIFIGKFSAQQNVADFENLSLETESYWDGSDLSGTSLASKYYTEFSSGDVTLNNTWITDWGGYWASDWLYSNSEDDTTSGYGNLHSCIAGMGANSSANYVIGGNKSFMKIDTSNNDSLVGFYITNTTYAHNSMRDGDTYGKVFGDSLNAAGENDSTNGEDFFKLTIYSIENGIEQDSVSFMLADFTFEEDSNDYIVDEWKFVDLSSFGIVDSIMFSLSSSDVGLYGMNTPAYFALDDVKIGDTTFGFENLELEDDSFFNGSDLSGTPDNPNYFATFNSGIVTFNNTWDSQWDYWKSGWAYSNMTDSATSGSGNKYSAITAKGALDSEIYGIGTNNSYLTYDTASHFSAFVTNSTYAYLSMRDGDSFGKQFGSNSNASGEDDGTNGEDFFKLNIYGFNNDTLIDSTIFHLADYTFDDPNEDYLVNTWEYVEMPSSLVDSVVFVLTSSDVGQYGMNTPAFFSIDNIGNYPLTSLSELKSANIEIFPNPSSDFIKIKNIGNENSYTVNIYDLFGRMITSNSNSPEELNISSLNKGQYIIQIISDNYNHKEVFVKE